LTARAGARENRGTMKTFLIVLLSAALLAAAVFTCPDVQNFRDQLARSRTPGDATNFRRAMSEMEAGAFADTCTFQDRLLWVDVQRNGKTIYTGAFAHWFKYGSAEGKPSVTKSAAAKPAAPRPAEARPAAARKPARKRPIAAAE
jgi:hypothetical protein